MAGLSQRLGRTSARSRSATSRYLWLGQTGSAIGDGLSFVAIAFAVLSIGGSATEIGIVFAAFFLPSVIFLLVGGVWADRLPRNLVMLTSDGVRAVVQIGQAILLFTGSAEVWHIVVAAALHGTASAFFVPASTGLMPQVVSPGRLQQANALVTLSRSAAFHRSGGIRHPGRRQRTEASYSPSTRWLRVLDDHPGLDPDRSRGGHRGASRSCRADRVARVRSRDWLIGSLLVFGISNMAMGSFMVLGSGDRRPRAGRCRGGASS